MDFDNKFRELSESIINKTQYEFIKKSDKVSHVRRTRRIRLTAAISATLVIIFSISVYGFVLKKQNDELFSQAETNEDFKYTKFNKQSEEILNKETEISEKNQINTADPDDSGSGAIPGDTEIISDPKAAIYNKMLNTIDYFNSLSLTLETSRLSDVNNPRTIEFTTNINAKKSYVKVSAGDVVISEIYVGNDVENSVNHKEKTCTSESYRLLDRSDAPYVPLAERITTDSDGIPCYYNRPDLTNCIYSSYSIFPQGITFSYLKDFDKWEIVDDSTVYLGRNCITIEGLPTPYTREKHGLESFTMIVDEQTGVLMQMTGVLDGNVSTYTKVINCNFESESEIKSFDKNEYSSFSEIKIER